MTFYGLLEPVAWTAIPADHIEQEGGVEPFRAIFGHVRPRPTVRADDPLDQSPQAKRQRIIEIDDGVGAIDSHGQRRTIGALDQPALPDHFDREQVTQPVVATVDPTGLPV